MVQVEPYLWWQCYAAGTTVEAVARFYAGVCNGPFDVALQDTLTLVEGFNRKRIDCGGPHVYVKVVGTGSNDTDTTVTDAFWISR